MQHTHIECFSKTARSGNQGDLIFGFPPFADKGCFVNVKAVIFTE